MILPKQKLLGVHLWYGLLIWYDLRWKIEGNDDLTFNQPVEMVSGVSRKPTKPFHWFHFLNANVRNKNPDTMINKIINHYNLHRALKSLDVLSIEKSFWCTYSVFWSLISNSSRVDSHFPGLQHTVQNGSFKPLH